jgi:hypothetical protein
MARKNITFTILRKKSTDIAPLLENGAHTIMLEKNSFTLADFKCMEGDSYSAVLCVNNNPLCTCRNNGDETELCAFDTRGKAIMAGISVKLKDVRCEYKGKECDITLGQIADILADTAANDIKNTHLSLATIVKMKGY